MTGADRDAHLTPGPAGTMEPIDRFTVRLARHAPGLPRAGFPLARLGRRAGASVARAPRAG